MEFLLQEDDDYYGDLSFGDLFSRILFLTQAPTSLDANDPQAGVLQKMTDFGSLQQRLQGEKLEILGFEFRRSSCVGGEEAAVVAAKGAK